MSCRCCEKPHHHHEDHHEADPCHTQTIKSVGVALSILEAVKDECRDLPADVRITRATRVLTELVTILLRENK